MRGSLMLLKALMRSWPCRERVYPPEEFIVNQPQHSNRDLSPLRQLSNLAPHYLTPSVTPILSEERGNSTLGQKDRHFPPTCHQTAISACIPALNTFLPVCWCGEAPLDAQGILGAQSGPALRSLPRETANLKGPPRPATPTTLPCIISSLPPKLR